MASATLTYVTGVNAATNYVRVGHNSSAVNNDAVWSFSLAASTGVAKWTGVKFTLKWNNTSAGTGWSGSYSYVFAVSSSGSAGRTAQSGTVLGRTTVTLSGASGTATATITGLSLTPGTTYYLRANQNGSTHSTMKAFQKASNTCESTANTWTTGTIYYNAGTAWLPQTGQVGGTANGSQYCKSLISALGHTHFASANGSSALTETYNYNSTAFNAYNSTTLFNPPAGYRHSPEATQLFVYDYTKGTWLNHSGASAASINFRNYSLNWGDTIVMFTNWLINTLTVNYHANGGSFGTQSGTTRYRVSSNLVQQSTNSGSSWTTLSTTGNINSNVDCHNVTTSGYGGGLKKTGYHVNSGAEFNTKADGTGVNVNQDNGSTNVPSVYRINGNANLTDNKTITLYVNWKPNTYTVTFNKNGGPANGSNSVTATYAAAMPSATMPTRAGYTFDGYYDAASGGTQYYTATGASARAWNKTSDTILYAHWTKNSYNLTLNCTEGSYQILPYDKDISNWSQFQISDNQYLTKDKDGYFTSGVNNVTSYVNNSSSGNGTSTITRIAKQSDNPFSNASYELQVAVSKNANTAYIGFVESTQSAASKVFQHIFVAKLPVGYNFEWASNSTGDGRSFQWLTPKIGTGKYEVYAYQLNCGSSGTFSTFGHVYVQPNNTAFTFNFYVAYSQIFDISKSQVFSVAYNTVTTALPKPIRPGYKFVGWGRSFNGSQQGIFGRDMFYTDKINIHFKAYMDNWSLYGSTPMRMISCTETGGWNIETSAVDNDYKFAAIFYDNGASAYKYTYSTTLLSEMSSGWHTFDITFNGTNVTFYIDGVLEGTSENFSGAIKYHASNGLFVGCEAVANETTGGSPYFTGQMTAPLVWHGTNLQSEDNRQITMPAGGWTLTSLWQLDTSQTSTLTLDPNGGTISSTSVTDIIGSTVTLPVPTKAGYRFKGWYYDLDGYRYAAYSRNLMYSSQTSIHCDVYVSNWADVVNGIPILSCTEGGGWDLYPSSNNYMSAYGYDSGASAYKGIEDDQAVANYESGWHHFDIVFDGTDLKLYIDDRLAGTSETFTGTLGYQSYNDILIGAEATGYALDFDIGNYPFFSGKVANLRITNSNIKISNLDVTQFQMPAINAKIVAWWEEAPSYIKLYTISNNTPTSTITNLTNTTWYFNEDLTNTTANAEYDITFNSNNTTYEQLVTVSDTYIVYNPDTVYYGGQKWFNENFRTIEITGGTDITSQQLISWLYDNATLYSSPQWVDIELQHYFSQIPTTITNLTNTVWILNNNLTIPHYMSTESTGGLRVRSDHSLSASEVTMIYPGDLVIFTGNIYNDGDLDWYELSNGWSVGMYLVDLNLEGNINFTSNNTNFATISLQNNVLNYITNETPSTTINIYNNGYITDNYKTIEINGGNDVTNTTLISWLQNNATLQPILSFQSSPVKIYTPSGWQIVQS